MKIFHLLILSVFFSTASYALTITGDNGVEVLAINGKEVETSFFSSKKIELDAGEHQIVVRYVNQFNDEQLIESQPAIFTLDLQEDTLISVQAINTQKQAEKLIRAGLIWQIITENSQYEVKNSDLLEGQGFMPYSDIEALIATYNQQANVTIQSKVVSKELSSEVVATTEVLTADNISAQLISLYQQASKEDKKAFRLWLIEQDMK